MKFAYLIAQNMTTLDTGVVEAGSMAEFFEQYYKEKGYHSNVILDLTESQYRSIIAFDDKRKTPSNTAGVIAFIVP